MLLFVYFYGKAIFLVERVAAPAATGTRLMEDLALRVKSGGCPLALMMSESSSLPSELNGAPS